MTGSEQETHVQNPGVANDKASRIRRLNDEFRVHGRGNGRLLMTQGVRDLGDDAVMALLVALRVYDAFTTDNDPYGEHDMGTLTWGRQKLFWKIDYYDRNLEFGSPDPTDDVVTTRILTLLLASEY